MPLQSSPHLNLLDGRLHAVAAIFWLETRDQQISRFAPSGLGRETANAGKSRSQGAEVALTAAVATDFLSTTSTALITSKTCERHLASKTRRGFPLGFIMPFSVSENMNF